LRRLGTSEPGTGGRQPPLQSNLRILSFGLISLSVGAMAVRIRTIPAEQQASPGHHRGPTKEIFHLQAFARGVMARGRLPVCRTHVRFVSSMVSIRGRIASNSSAKDRSRVFPPLCLKLVRSPSGRLAESRRKGPPFSIEDGLKFTDHGAKINVICVEFGRRRSIRSSGWLDVKRSSEDLKNYDEHRYPSDLCCYRLICHFRMHEPNCVL